MLYYISQIGCSDFVNFIFTTSSKMATSTKTDPVSPHLTKLGLSENEAVLYTLMLRYPRSTVKEMLEKTPFPRTMLYHVLGQLTKRGLATAVKNQWRTVYIAENPQRLYRLLEEKEEVFAEETRHMREIIPALKDQYRLAGRRPDIRLFEGLKEYQRALQDMLLTGPDEICSYFHPSHVRKPGIEFRESFERKRVSRKMLRKNLLSLSAEAKKFLKQTRSNDYTPFRFVKNHPEFFSADVQLYAGKVLYTTYEDHEPIALLIDDQLFYGMQKNLFESLWKSAQPATLFHAL